MNDRYNQRPTRSRTLEVLGDIERARGPQNPVAGLILPNAKPPIRNGRRIGGSVTLAASDLTNFYGLIEVDGDDEFATVMTATLGLQLVGFAADPATPVTGRVQWGSGGVQQSADFDVRNGTCISVPASFMRISVRRDSTYPASLGMNVTAQVGYFPRATGNATRTLRRDTTMGANSDDDFDVPNFSRLVTALRSPRTAAMRLDFLAQGSGTPVAAVQVAASTDVFRIPIPDDATTIRIFADGADIDRLRVIYDLDL